MSMERLPAWIKLSQQKLQKTYGVRLWSEKERATLVYDTPTRGKQKTRKA